MKTKLKKTDIVIIKALRWFERTNGNTYHSVRVYINNKEIGYNPFTYGYGEAYLQTAYKILLDKGIFPKTDKYLESGIQADHYNIEMYKRNHREQFIIFVDDVNRKKDL